MSKEQQAYAASLHADLPLEIRLQDYRDLDERFDAIASIGMFEHVGKKNYRSFMQTAHRCLAPDGVFLLQTIGHIHDAIDGLFVAEDLHNLGPDYDRTLMAWHENFEQGWPGFADSLGGRFYRKWRYYLLSCAGAFRARDLLLWQWTLSKQGIQGGCPREV